MRSQLHHLCIAVKEFDWYLKFFEEVFGMTIERTAKEAPHRQLWFDQGIQLKEVTEEELLENGNIIDHISLGVDDIPATVAEALAHGCPALPNGEHWFALPNGVKIELKPYR